MSVTHTHVRVFFPVCVCVQLRVLLCLFQREERMTHSTRDMTHSMCDMPDLYIFDIANL